MFGGVLLMVDHAESQKSSIKCLGVTILHKLVVAVVKNSLTVICHNRYLTTLVWRYKYWVVL